LPWQHCCPWLLSQQACAASARFCGHCVVTSRFLGVQQHGRHIAADGIQGKKIDAFAAHPGTAKTAIWDKMDKEKVEGVAFDLTAKVPVRWSAVLQAVLDLT